MDVNIVYHSVDVLEELSGPALLKPCTFIGVVDCHIDNTMLCSIDTYGTRLQAVYQLCNHLLVICIAIVLLQLLEWLQLSKLKSRVSVAGHLHNIMHLSSCL